MMLKAFFVVEMNIYLVEDGVDMLRFMIFLISYGICVISVGNLLLYLNYLALGYSWSAVGSYLLTTAELYLAIGSLIVLFIVVFDLIPSRFPFF